VSYTVDAALLLICVGTAVVESDGVGSVDVVDAFFAVTGVAVVAETIYEQAKPLSNSAFRLTSNER
jgi:hypothetical protein